MLLMLFQSGESKTVYCVPLHMFVSVFLVFSSDYFAPTGVGRNCHFCDPPSGSFPGGQALCKMKDNKHNSLHLAKNYARIFVVKYLWMFVLICT